jgi:transcription antitermination factor NusA-like protein
LAGDEQHQDTSHGKRHSDYTENEDGEEISPQVTVRLLVPSDQIGCILGKGGQIIQGIRSEIGAQIRVLSNDHIPASDIWRHGSCQKGSSSSVISPP